MPLILILKQNPIFRSHSLIFDCILYNLHSLIYAFLELSDKVSQLSCFGRTCYKNIVISVPGTFLHILLTRNSSHLIPELSCFFYSILTCFIIPPFQKAVHHSCLLFYWRCKLCYVTTIFVWVLHLVFTSLNLIHYCT